MARHNGCSLRQLLGRHAPPGSIEGSPYCTVCTVLVHHQEFVSIQGTLTSAIFRNDVSSQEVSIYGLVIADYTLNNGKNNIAKMLLV